MKPENQVIELARITCKPVRLFIERFNLMDSTSFAAQQPVCYHPNGSFYHKHNKTFFAGAALEKVWQTYKTISPAEAWSGEMIQFGLQFSRKKMSFVYPDDPHTGHLEEGQILILNLRIAGGMVNIAVGHEVVEIDDSKKQLKICYLENGKSVGSQFVKLIELNNKSTRIEHETFYRSKSLFRDKVLYPHLHTQAITEFHNNVIRKAVAP